MDSDGIGHLIHICCYDMVGRDVGQSTEPEHAQTGEHSTLMRDWRVQHPVEGGNSIRRNDKQALAQVIVAILIDISDFTSGSEHETAQVGRRNTRRRRHHQILREVSADSLIGCPLI